ncbi:MULTISPECIES: preprotein translocase subunit YajC [unclassified Gilliamella]|uniref:preprotein translocase subunit YajC n=1 Tax=unclassified Gilliamella TaxID=2685620 RepID=UPI00226AC0C9|nr:MULTISPECIES: preprotein translocase subunit YajC [unclassified Gilliamella]MCX8643142.1 preprotein translocase subunit YajC [Gilliamella sp. B3835]MCX8708533.1 preprotein translocase subunit YajC [Gilliamella sp. B3783]MCX8709550.1 preprotein translocase subunit YajC [Gilliamella sp. B3780]MCX8711906.1 preprotein translocase subunit YajC [Gilliamella sp. B3468]MCX8715291.1 preprotein translocase subunit YajC [Gilliamella sp. B3781]
MDFLISNAYATEGAAAESNPYFLPIMLVVFGLFFYFMIMRPQQKRAKAHRELMASISKGDEVLTNGGLIGRVSKVNDNGYIALELNDTTEVVIKRDFITSVLPKGTMKSL